MRIGRVLSNIKRKLLYGNRCSSESFVKYLKTVGATIGNGVEFYDPSSCSIDTTTPQLLTMGNNVRITHGVTILTHDYSWSVLAGAYGECLGGIAPVTIGSNVFIGINAIILKGVTIGDNVIIGAGSVVTKDIPSNEVWGGNPARKIMDLEEYYKRKQKASVFEAETLVKMMHTNPNIPYSVLREYEPLFKDYKDEAVQKLFRDTNYADKCNAFYETQERKYQDFAELKKVIQKET